MQIIVFSVNDKCYAINTKNVEEISKNMTYTTVPNSPDWVKGLINLRGNVVTLVNLSILLHQVDAGCYNDIIVIQNAEEQIGLLINEVIEVIDIDNSSIQKIDDGGSVDFIGIVNLDDKLINIIDIDTLLSKNEGFI